MLEKYNSIVASRVEKIFVDIKNATPFILHDKDSFYVVSAVDFLNKNILKFFYDIGCVNVLITRERADYLKLKLPSPSSSKSFYFDLDYFLNDLPYIKKVACAESLDVLPPNFKLIGGSLLDDSLSSILKYLQIIPSAIFCKINECQINFLKARYMISLLDINDFYIYKENQYEIRSVVSSDIVVKHKSDFLNSVLYNFCFNNSEHNALIIGDALKDEIPILRIHFACYTGDVLHSAMCDCREQLSHAFDVIKESGKGIIFYINQEGRGIGLKNKIIAYKLQKKLNLDTIDANNAIGFCDDERDYNMLKEMLAHFNIKSCYLVTNNPVKQKILTDIGINVVNVIPSCCAFNKYNNKYLMTKKQRMNHSLKEKTMLFNDI